MAKPLCRSPPSNPEKVLRTVLGGLIEGSLRATCEGAYSRKLASQRLRGTLEGGQIVGTKVGVTVPTLAATTRLFAVGLELPF